MAEFIGSYRVTCSSCGSEIYYERWEGKPTVTRALTCPRCGASLGVTGTTDSVAVTKEPPTPPPPPAPAPTPKFIGSYRVTCPSCSAVIYYERWEGKPTVTRALTCPRCGASLGVTGTTDSVAVTKEPPTPPPPPAPAPTPKFIGSYRVTCPSCSAVIYYERWEGKPEVTRALNCPVCGASLGVTGTTDSVAVVEEPPPAPEPKFIGSYRVTCSSCRVIIYYEQWEGKPTVTRALTCPCCGTPLGVTGTINSVAALQNGNVICVTAERQREPGEGVHPICGPGTCPPPLEEPAPPPPPPPEISLPEPPHGLPEEFTPIGTTTDTFFWSLQSFGGKLWAGTYGTPKAFNFPPWTHLKNFPAGESIPDFAVFKNRLYASSEKKGHIYRMKAPTDWEIVHDDSWLYCLCLAIFNGYLYCDMTTPHKAYGHSYADHKVIRSSNGTSWSQCAYWSNKWMGVKAVYKNELYAVGMDYTNDRSYAVRTSNGTTWRKVDALCNVSDGGWMDEAVAVFNNKLFLGMRYTSDKKAKIYKYDGSSLTKVFETAKGPEPSFLYVFNNEIYCAVGQAWKTGGSSYLFRSPTGEAGSWKLVQTFSGKPNFRCMAEHNNELYLGVQNTVYKIGVVETFTTETITHACGAKISYQMSSDAARNVALTCPYDNLSLGVSGIKETVTITNIDAMAAKLQGEIAALDNRIAELEAKIESFRAERDKVREILGV